MTVSPFSTVAPISTPDLSRDSRSAIATLAVHCELVRGTEDRVLEELMPRVREAALALDLSNVDRIDAAGIAVLITLYCTGMEAGNEFFVVNPSARVLDMLRLVGLESILLPAGDADPRRQRGAAFERPAA